MKKTILGISFLMMAAFAGNANAQCAKDKCPDKENCKKEICEKKNCKESDCKKGGCPVADCTKDNCRKNAEGCAADTCDRKGPYCKMPYNRTGRGPQEMREVPQCCANASYFEGLDLSDDQKTKIQDLDNALLASRKEMREAVKDRTTLPERADRRANEIELRTKYLADLKNILSPEQFSTFLQNFYINQMPGQNSMKAGSRLDLKRQKLERLKEKEVKSSDVVKDKKDSKDKKDKNDKKKK